MSLKHALLGLLNYGPMTGYDLKSIFDKSIVHFWSASTSQIYRDLGVLEEEGLVTSRIEPQEGRPDKKIYMISETGREAFVTWLNRFPPILESPSRHDFLLRVFFGSHIPMEDLRFQFQRFVKEAQEMLRNLNGIAMKTEGVPPDLLEREKFFWGLTIKMGFISLEAAIGWAQECIKEIDAYQAQNLNTMADSTSTG